MICFKYIIKVFPILLKAGEKYESENILTLSENIITLSDIIFFKLIPKDNTVSFHLFFPILFLYSHAVQGSLLSSRHNGAKGNLLKSLFFPI